MNIGTQIIGNWGGYTSYSLGEVRSIHPNGMIEVDFDDLDGFSLFWPREIKPAVVTASGAHDYPDIGVYQA